MSRKDYKKGMADAMEAYQAFSEKQEAATRHVAKQVEKVADNVDRLGGKIGEITNYITDQEKVLLYHLNTPMDIIDLGNQEKKMLVAILYQLASDEAEVTEEQQNYIRAVQQYLSIFNPQTEIDLEVVEDIEDISTQKAVLQAVLEFLYLGTHPKSYTEEQMDFLDCFQLNRKTRKEIMANIETMAEAVGKGGIAEKYGFVPAEDDEISLSYTDNGSVSAEVALWCAKGVKPIETQDYYCRLNTLDESATFNIIHKRTGEQKDVLFERGWTLRQGGIFSLLKGGSNYCTKDNHIYISVCKREEGKLLHRVSDIDVDTATWKFIGNGFSVLQEKGIAWMVRMRDTEPCDLTLSDGILLHGKEHWFMLPHPDRQYKIAVPFIIQNAVACEGRILMIGENQSDEEIGLYWHDPIKNHTYKATTAPLFSKDSDSVLGYYSDDATAKIKGVYRAKGHLTILLRDSSGEEPCDVLCKYVMNAHTGTLEIVCKGGTAELVDTVLTEENGENGNRIRDLHHIVKRYDSGTEYYDCETLEKLVVKEPKGLIEKYGDYLVKKEDDILYKTNINSNQLWEVV